MKNKLFITMAIFAISAFAIICCKDDDPPPQNQTPVVEDFNNNGTGTFTFDGNQKVVTVTAQKDKTKGAVTVKYNENTAAPSTSGINI